jgi:hypothetical protein
LRTGARPLGVTGMEASVTNRDDDQAAAQHSQSADDDGEEASGNAIKVTHDTPLGTKGDGADQLIKTFGIVAATMFGTDFSPRSRFCVPPAGVGRPARRGRIVEPDQADATCPVPFAKIFRFTSDPNQFYVPRHPGRHEGRFAIVTDVGLGMRWTQVAPKTSALILRTVKPCGPDAPTLASSSREASFSRAMVARKPGHQGERGISRKTIAQGRPGVPVDL